VSCCQAKAALAAFFTRSDRRRKVRAETSSGKREWQEDADPEYTAREVRGAFEASDREILMARWQDEKHWDTPVPDEWQEWQEPWPGQGPDDPFWDERVEGEASASPFFLVHTCFAGKRHERGLRDGSDESDFQVA
jgi:hypothetical protein